MTCVSMLPSVYLNYQFFLVTPKIHDILPKHDLQFEFQPKELVSPKEIPNFIFPKCLLPPQSSSGWYQVLLVYLHAQPLPDPPQTWGGNQITKLMIFPFTKITFFGFFPERYFLTFRSSLASFLVCSSDASAAISIVARCLPFT